MIVMKNTNKAFLLLIVFSLIVIAACKKENNVTGVSINKETLTITVNESAQLTASVEPEDAEDKGLLWSSSDESVASVDNGLVMGISAGNVTITVETVDGGFTASCAVTVTENAINVTSITLGTTSVSMVPAETLQLNYVIQPGNATDQTVAWTSSSDAVATVSSSGLVTAIAAGTTTITVKTTDGSKTATCEVTVTPVGTIDEIMSKGFLTNSCIGSVDIACDANGTTYIAFQTPDASLASSKAYVQVYNYSGGTTWSKYSGQNVGICTASYITANAPSLAIKDDGTVFVSYEYYDDMNDNRYDAQIVSAYDGTSWVTLGGDGSTNNNCFIMDGSNKLEGPTQMAFKQDGTLMMVMRNSGDGYVNYYDNGSDWSNIPTGDWTSYSGYKLDNSSFWAQNVNIAVHGNKPYAYIRSSTSCGVLSGPETNGENVQWEWMGSLVGSDIGGQNRDYETPLAISSTGEIYSCYQKIVGVDCNIYVKHFNTSSNNWEIIYTGNFGSYQNEAEVIISNDILYLAVAKYDGGIEIYKYDDDANSWSYEGSTPDFGAIYYTIDLAPGNNGEFYIAYTITDDGSDYEIGAFKYTPFQ
ncbi:MAG: hypothetical protein C0594_17875 [Marinilabiliales bacterium]|nr:MAG: hypothetical protein C0594_17875 [Marinilabiliales bacterium]